jgi:class 3 adenylate cyclase
VLARVVKQNNGVVDKFVGDALMAIFGAPISHGNDALDAAKCALSLVIEREKLNQTSRHKLRIGVGLATGKMVAGCMGSTDRLNYTVLGERVNLAARLCSQAKAGQVIIDQTTRERLGETISSAPLPELHLKGFLENIVAYELRGAGDVKLND